MVTLPCEGIVRVPQPKAVHLDRAGLGGNLLPRPCSRLDRTGPRLDARGCLRNAGVSTELIEVIDLAAIDPLVYERVAEFVRGAVRNIFDSRVDWTPNAEAIICAMRDGGMSPIQEKRFRPYFELFVDRARRGEAGGSHPSSWDEAFAEYPPSIDVDALLAVPDTLGAQLRLFDETQANAASQDRALIDQLIAETRLYTTSEAMKELLDFVGRMRNMAPFNAMLLHVQKPGLSYAMTARDWRERFGRWPKEHARPLIILRNFGPVSFVYDVLDTEGERLPDAAFAFPTAGAAPRTMLDGAIRRLIREKIDIVQLDHGDWSAGYARLKCPHGDEERLEQFEIGINRNHDVPVRIVSLAHELAHIYLGHCGDDIKRNIHFNRPGHSLMEVEAETVAYVVAKRANLSPRSESYLASYKESLEDLDIYRVLACANKIERLMGLSCKK